MPSKCLLIAMVISLVWSCSLTATQKDIPLCFSASYWNAGNTRGESVSATFLRKKHLFHLNHLGGIGFNVNHVREDNAPYITATPWLLKGGGGPDHWFSKTIPSNMDTIYVGVNQHYALNLFFHWEVFFTDRISIGCNLDALGFSFGKRKKALLYYGDDGDYFSRYTPATPTTLNMNWPGAAKIGTCQIDVFLNCNVYREWSIAVGYLHQVSEFSVLEPVNYINSRNVNINTARYRAANNGFKVTLCYRLNRSSTHRYSE